MSQSDFGTIVPSTKSGSQLATDLNNWRDALHSFHSGTSRPLYVIQGMVWLDTTNDPLWDLKLYDGSADITIGTFNSTDDKFTPSLTALTSDSIKEFSGKLGAVRPVLTKNSGYQAVATDRHKLINFTASATLLLEPAATLGDGWDVIVYANGYNITIDPDSTETINGAATYNLSNGSAALILCDGTAFYAFEISDPSNAKLNTTQSFTKSQGVTPVALTDGATINTDGNLSNNFTVTLEGNRTLANPTNLVAGKTYIWTITQDGTGSRTLSFGSYFKFPGGTAPTLTTDAGAVDKIIGDAVSSTRIECNTILDLK